MRGRQFGLLVRQHVEISECLRLDSVVASSIATTSYSKPRYWSTSFSDWKCPAIMRDPFLNVSVPRCPVNSCGNRRNNLRLRSSNDSITDFPTFRSSKHFNPG